MGGIFVKNIKTDKKKNGAKVYQGLKCLGGGLEHQKQI